MANGYGELKDKGLRVASALFFLYLIKKSLVKQKFFRDKLKKEL